MSSNAGVMGAEPGLVGGGLVGGGLVGGGLVGGGWNDA